MSRLLAYITQAMCDHIKFFIVMTVIGCSQASIALPHWHCNRHICIYMEHLYEKLVFLPIYKEPCLGCFRVRTLWGVFHRHVDAPLIQCCTRPQIPGAYFDVLCRWAIGDVQFLAWAPEAAKWHTCILPSPMNAIYSIINSIPLYYTMIGNEEFCWVQNIYLCMQAEPRVSPCRMFACEKLDAFCVTSAMASLSLSSSISSNKTSSP